MHDIVDKPERRTHKTQSSCMHMTDQDMSQATRNIWYTQSTNTCTIQEQWVKL